MLRCDPAQRREPHAIDEQFDLVVVGGGMAGVCCSITAARQGLRVVLVQDRPVLGGNASSEVRLWILGATSHMGNNNRWSREGGVIDEILIENAYRNREGNPVILDTILLEKVIAEQGITLLLNTVVHDLERQPDGPLKSVKAFCSQNSTQYLLRAPLFCDASGDGIVGFLAGAAFRMGAEAQREFGELLAPPETHRELLGHSLYFYTRDTGRPVRFTPPSYALDDITKIPRYRQFNARQQGCQLWWIEYGGRLDTVQAAEQIKWELWKVVYGVWNHIKNSGDFPEAETMTLEWVGMIPGKRESRRFEGDAMLIQQDIVEQRPQYDAVSFGGWAIDLHPSEGVYSAEDPCRQWHSRGVYAIPYRTMYSRNVPNLFLAGRIVAASHIAFGSTRVMATCAHNAQAVGMAAAICKAEGRLPRDLARPNRVGALQQALLRSGQYIPGVVRQDPCDLAQKARISASSELQLRQLTPNGKWRRLDEARALLAPVPRGRLPGIRLDVLIDEHAQDAGEVLEVELRTSSRLGGFTPDVMLETIVVPLTSDTRVDVAPPSATRHASVGNDSGEDKRSDSGKNTAHNALRSSAAATALVAQTHVMAATTAARREERWEAAMGRRHAVEFEFKHSFAAPAYAFVCLKANPRLSVLDSDDLPTGVTTVLHQHNHRVAKSMVQLPPPHSGIEAFEFWTPQRRPGHKNLAIAFAAPICLYSPANAVNGVGRPTTGPNAWVAAQDDEKPRLELRWPAPQLIESVELTLDTDWDQPLESVLMGHPEGVMPCCVREIRIMGYRGQLLAEKSGNHQTRCVFRLSPPVKTDELTIELKSPSAHAPAALYEVSCYGPVASS